MSSQPISTDFMERRMAQLAERGDITNSFSLASSVLDTKPDNINALDIVLNFSYELGMYKRGVYASNKLIGMRFRSLEIYSCGLENAHAYYLSNAEAHNSDELEKTFKFMVMCSRKLKSYYDSEEIRNLIVKVYLELPEDIGKIFHAYNNDIIEKDRPVYIEMVKCR